MPKVTLTPTTPKISPTAEYITSGGNEIRVTADDQGLYYCYFYKGGELPAVLQGKYTNKTTLRQVIVNYLMSDNVRGNAKWPK